MTRKLDRRRTLKTIGSTGLLALGVSLAGCSSSDASSTDATTATTEATSESSGGGEWEQTDTVEMTAELKFAPKRIQVSKGTTVTWENTGSIGHTITAYEDEIPDGAAYFASGDFDTEQAARDGYPDGGNVTEGGTYEHTFETKGTYKYFCVPHEMNGMVGFVKVV